MSLRLISSLLLGICASLVASEADTSLFARVLEKAKKERFEEQDGIRAKIDEIIYQEYVAQQLKQKQAQLQPTEAELKAAYEASPLIRLRHLAIKSANATQAPPALVAVQKQLSRGADFEKLVHQYSDADSAAFGGDTDFRGLHNFSPQFYSIGLNLKQKEVSSPYWEAGYFHLFQRIDTRKYENVFPNYRVFLENRIRSERRDALLKEMVANQ